jgi:chemotaxis protein histidine kinase CheA
MNIVTSSDIVETSPDTGATKPEVSEAERADGEQAGEPTENIVRFEPKELTDVRKAAENLVDMPEVDRSYFLPKKAAELGLAEKALQAAARRLEEDRAGKLRAEAAAKEQHEQDRLHKTERQAEKEADKVEKQAKKEAEKREAAVEKAAALKAAREQRKVEKEAARKAKEKHKGFANLLKLPVDRHDNELSKLATRLDEDLEALRQEFKEFLGVELGATTPAEATEPWPEPVVLAPVLTEVGAKISKYVVMQPHLLTAAVLLTAHNWLYDHGIVTHSPILAAASAEPDSGKSTLVAVVGRASPRYSLNIEMTGPSLYRFVDAGKPTLVIDEADDLFARKSDLKHIINAGWTRGAKIPRQVNIGGVSTTVFFDPFTPKAIALLGRNLPPTVRTRCIELRMLPKRDDEQVEEFKYVDDAEFAVLRRKLCRFAADNATALRDAKPTMPSGLNNRAAANWSLLLAIAALAGGPWPQRAREAAERLTRSGRRPSDGVQLLAAFKAVSTTGKTEVTSEAIVVELRKDPTAIWADYNHGGPITQRQVAVLLDAYDIHPVSLHPTKRKDFARQGYKLTQFADAFARYLPDDPIIQSPATKQAKKRKASRIKNTKRKTLSTKIAKKRR